MNIFFLDKCPVLAAELQVQKSATKMVLESAQMLSDCVRFFGYTSDDVYKGAYRNHPSTRWVRQSRSHFEWLAIHAIALSERYTRVFGKTHASHRVIEKCSKMASYVAENGFKIVADDLAIKSSETGLQAYQTFLKSEQKFDDVVIAYKKFYYAKSYVSNQPASQL